MKVTSMSNSKAHNSRGANKNRNGPKQDRFAGNVQVNTGMIRSAQRMKEPNWYELDLDELNRALVLCNNRVKDGNSFYKGIGQRIAKAIEVKQLAKVSLENKAAKLKIY